MTSLKSNFVLPVCAFSNFNRCSMAIVPSTSFSLPLAVPPIISICSFRLRFTAASADRNWGIVMFPSCSNDWPEYNHKSPSRVSQSTALLGQRPRRPP